MCSVIAGTSIPPLPQGSQTSQKKQQEERRAGRREEHCEMLPAVHGVEPEYMSTSAVVSHKIKSVKGSCMNNPLPHI